MTDNFAEYFEAVPNKTINKIKPPLAQDNKYLDSLHQNRPVDESRLNIKLVNRHLYLKKAKSVLINFDRLPFAVVCLEKVVRTRITDHVKSSYILTPSQYGFRKKNSTLHAQVDRDRNLIPARTGPE